MKHCMCGCIYLEAECPNCNKVTDADRIEELEAKLAKAVDALEAGVICTTKHGGAAEFLRIASAIRAELKVKKDE